MNEDLDKLRDDLEKIVHRVYYLEKVNTYKNSLPMDNLFDVPPPNLKIWDILMSDYYVLNSSEYSVTRDKGCFHAGVKWAREQLKDLK